MILPHCCPVTALIRLEVMNAPIRRIQPEAVARVIRAARKLSGKSQVSMAQMLGVSQAVYSRFEAGKSVPSICEWHALCDFLQFDGYTAIDKGYIDRCTPGVRNIYPESRFKTPDKYSKNAGTKVRTAKVLLQYFEKLYGTEKVDQYFEHIGVDPDLFVVMDQQINIRFSLEIYQLLIQRGQIRAGNIPEIVSCLNTENIQGQLRRMYEKCNSKQDLFRTLFENSNNYEINSSYQIDIRGLTSGALWGMQAALVPGLLFLGIERNELSSPRPSLR